MKKNQILHCLTLLLFLFSCSRSSEELQSEDEILSFEKNSIAHKSVSELPIVYAVVYPDGSCVNGARYKYYATATDVVPYDRHVYSIAKRGDATIILPLRIIPANQNVSAAIGVFGNDKVKLGDISLQAQHVFKNNISTDVSNEFDRPFVDFHVNNCVTIYVSPPANPCQVDSNDNGVPDCFE